VHAGRSPKLAEENLRGSSRGFPAHDPPPSIVLDVTEIPEHLLKRSKQAKAKAEGAEAPADAPATSTAPATTQAAAAPAVAAKAAAPAAPVAPVVKPDSPVVAAYKKRKKIPVWAMVGLSILPVWAFMYVLALKPVAVVASGPTGDGAGLFATNCSGCHGAGGEGVGSAYGFVGGSVMKTFPHIEDQLRWVSYGTQQYLTAGIAIYGDPNREGGPHKTGASGGQMPGWRGADKLKDAEILAAVCHERYDLGGGDVTSAEYALWCAPDSAIYAALKDGSATFDTLHTKFAAEKVMEIGPVPKAGSSKS
jgi:mono/diheme cytochrome c family protein